MTLQTPPSRQLRITFLGTGTSHGVPPIDCMIAQYAHCPKGVCLESRHDPRHRRTRTSALIETATQTLLIDATPDFREQMLREKVTRIDAVLLTHRHADHIGGLPDIRSYTRDRATELDLYGSAETVAAIRQQFAWIFDPDTFAGGGIPRLATHAIAAPFSLGPTVIVPVPVVHGPLSGCYGYRIGPLAYIPDIKVIDTGGLALLDGVDTLVLDCLRETHDHVTHLNLAQSIALARRIRPRVCYFTHMSHDIHYLADRHHLDPWMSFANDGLTITVPWETATS